MVTPFDRAMAIVFEHEGGVSSDRKDTAGDGTGRPHTNLGVTLKAVRALDADGRLGRFLHEGFDVDDDGDIDEADVPGWTRETAAEFYRRFYWQEAKCDSFSQPVAIALFDAAVNMGVGAAVKTLQRALGVSADGVVGSATLAAAWRFDSHAIVPKMLAARLDACRTFKTADAHFYGWAVRCFRLVEQAHAI